MTYQLNNALTERSQNPLSLPVITGTEEIQITDPTIRAKARIFTPIVAYRCPQTGNIMDARLPTEYVTWHTLN